MSVTLDKILEKVLFESKVRYVSNSKSQSYLIDKIRFNEDYDSNNSYFVSDLENNYSIDNNTKKSYKSFNQSGYIFVPHGVRIERKSQRDIGYGILGTANKSRGVIEILETLYGKDFEEVLMHESLHLEDWDASESTIRARTKERCNFETRFH